MPVGLWLYQKKEAITSWVNIANPAKPAGILKKGEGDAKR